jgi:hypothetical protein
MRSLLNLSVAIVLSAFAAASATADDSPSATVVGMVSVTAADGGAFPGEGARVTLTCPADGTIKVEVADDHGSFRFLNVPVDSCSIEADVQGFEAQPVSVVTDAGQVAASDLHLGVAPVRVGVNVAGAPFQEPTLRRGSCRSETGPRTSAKRCQR